MCFITNLHDTCTYMLPSPVNDRKHYYVVSCVDNKICAGWRVILRLAEEEIGTETIFIFLYSFFYI